jgi:hypothetical protein
MPKTEPTSKRAASAAGRFINEPKGSSSDMKSRAASALTQKPGKVSAGSERVIKDVSHEHRDALKRLVDR